MRQLLRIFAALLLSFVLSHASQAEEPAVRDALREVLEDFHQAYGFPGATVAVVLEDGSTETAAIGWADAEAEIAMTPESRMLAASIGKSIWGALVLALEADGVLNRADLVSDHLGNHPWFARLPNAETIKVGQLLTHAAGLPDHVHMEGVGADLISHGAQNPFDPTEAISYVLDEPPFNLHDNADGTRAQNDVCYSAICGMLKYRKPKIRLRFRAISEHIQSKPQRGAREVLARLGRRQRCGWPGF